MKKYFYPLFLLTFFFNYSIEGQVSVVFSEKVDIADLESKGLTEENRQLVTKVLSEKLAEYVKLGKLINPETREIDRASVANFKELFSLDAVVFNDLKEYPESFLFELDGYVDLARQYFPIYGLRFGLNSAEIVKVDYNPSDSYYVFTTKVSKTVEQYYTEGGEIKSGSLTYDLEFLYTLKLDKSENALILTIRGIVGKAPDTYTLVYGLGAGVELGQVSFSETSLFQNVKNSGEIEMKADLGLNIGFNMLTNFFNPKESPNKSLFLAVGATVFNQKLSGNLNNYSVSDRLNVNGEIPGSPNEQILVNGINREAKNINVEEIQKVTGIKIPLGIGYRIFKNNTSMAMVTVQYAPSILFRTEGEITGTGDYAIDIPEYQYNSSDVKGYDDEEFAEAYNIGVGKTITSKPELSTSFSHGVQLSGIFLKDLLDDDPTYGLSLGVHYYLPFTDLWSTQQDADKPFLYSDRGSYIDPGVMSPFAEKARLSQIGITLSIYMKKTKLP